MAGHKRVVEEEEEVVVLEAAVGLVVEAVVEM